MTGRPPDQRFHRQPGAAFDVLEIEQFAIARAKGGSIAAASSHVGISKPTGIKYEQHPEVKARIRELRSGAETFVGISKGWIISELKRNVELARDAEHYKTSNEALALLYKIANEDKDVANLMARAIDPDVSPQQLQQQLTQAFREPAPRKLPEHVVDAEGESLQ